MSEDDRAAKAARAKAMLKKRQQKKGGGPSTPSGADVASPATSTPGSRAFSPASPESTAQAPADHLDRRDLGDLFAKSDSDSSWLSSLPRAASPHPTSVPASPAAPAQTTDPKDALIEDHKHTIAALQSDKATLESQLRAFQDMESKFRGTEASLQTANSKVQSLEAHVHDVERKSRALQVSGEQESAKVKALEAQVNDAHYKCQQAEASLDRESSKVQALETHVRRIHEEKEALLENERQTIAVLVAEKSSLTADLERYEDIETKAQELEKAFIEEQQKFESTNARLQQLQAEATESARREMELQASEKEWSEKCREHERELQLMGATVEELQSEKDQQRRRIRDLEDQIQSDDRVERLEGSLKNTQDRAEELEFQLSKLKQAHATLKSEREEVDNQLTAHRDGESEWMQKYQALESEHLAAQQSLSSALADQEALSADKSAAQAKLDVAQKALVELQERLTQTAAELTSNARQLQNAQNDLRNSNRRAEDAERTQKELQTEGTALMRSLDEMRPKIVELTGAKLELAEQVDSLEHTLRSRDAVIAELEGSLEELTAQRDALDQAQQDAHALRERDRVSSQANSTELQTLYTELQAELDETRASILALQTERTRQHQETTHNLEEIDRLNASVQRQAEELELLQAQATERQEAQEDGQEYLERAQTEIESLRTEITARDEEIERMRGTISASTPTDIPPSLDAELLSSLRQQHALDLSAAQSQIRALENSVFEAEARSHTLAKHTKVLEDHLDKLRAQSRNGPRSFSPAAGPSRPVSRNTNASTSFSSHRMASQANLVAPPPLSRSVFDANMTNEIRHKRRVSLGMLKARIESEVAAASPIPQHTQHPLATVQEPSSSDSGSSSPLSHSHYHHRPQFLDEHHILWCHSCRGDLVVL